MARFKKDDTIRCGEMVKTVKGVLGNAYVLTDDTILLFEYEEEWEKQ